MPVTLRGDPGGASAQPVRYLRETGVLGENGNVKAQDSKKLKSPGARILGKAAGAPASQATATATPPEEEILQQ